MQEIWKSFNYKGAIYEVSTYGNIRGKRGILKQRINKDGYMCVTLGLKKNRTSVKVHRVVAEVFIERPLGKNEVNHIDFNRKNNNVENLEWCNHSENINHTILSGRHITQTRNMKGVNNPNYGNKALSKKYKENPTLAKKKQSRPGIKNGRCKEIYLILNDGEEILFEYMTQMVEYMISERYIEIGVSAMMNNVRKCIRNDSSYRGFKFRFK